MNTPDPVSRQPSCDDKYDPAWLPVDTALARIAQAVSPISDVEVVALREALDRVLGVDIQVPDARAKPHQLGDGWLCIAFCRPERTAAAGGGYRLGRQGLRWRCEHR